MQGKTPETHCHIRGVPLLLDDEGECQQTSSYRRVDYGEPPAQLYAIKSFIIKGLGQQEDDARTLRVLVLCSCRTMVSECHCVQMRAAAGRVC